MATAPATERACLRAKAYSIVSASRVAIMVRDREPTLSLSSIRAPLNSTLMQDRPWCILHSVERIETAVQRISADN